jgi:hypothetical protein
MQETVSISSAGIITTEFLNCSSNRDTTTSVGGRINPIRNGLTYMYIHTRQRPNIEDSVAPTEDKSLRFVKVTVHMCSPKAQTAKANWESTHTLRTPFHPPLRLLSRAHLHYSSLRLPIPGKLSSALAFAVSQYISARVTNQQVRLHAYIPALDERHYPAAPIVSQPYCAHRDTFPSTHTTWHT